MEFCCSTAESFKNSSFTEFLSGDGKAAFSPRVRPDAEYVIWQERAIDEPHNRSRDIMGMSLKELKV